MMPRLVGYGEHLILRFTVQTRLGFLKLSKEAAYLVRPTKCLVSIVERYLRDISTSCPGSLANTSYSLPTSTTKMTTSSLKTKMEKQNRKICCSQHLIHKTYEMSRLAIRVTFCKGKNFILLMNLVLSRANLYQELVVLYNANYSTQCLF
jgi:hypothetical protein